MAGGQRYIYRDVLLKIKQDPLVLHKDISIEFMGVILLLKKGAEGVIMNT